MEKLRNLIRSQTLKEMAREYVWLRQYSRHYKKEVLWYLFVGILGTVVSLAGSLLSKYIIDAVTGFDTRGAGVFYADAAIPDPVQCHFQPHQYEGQYPGQSTDHRPGLR